MKKVKGYIERKTMLYKTGVEYGDYTMNHIQGCAHGCKYPCYAFMMKKRFGQIKSYEEWLEPYLVSNTLELLDKEIPRLKDKIKSVQLCFSTDPFMYQYPEIQEVSLASIKKLNDVGIKCSVLTKGILPIELAKFSKENEYGITLITTDEVFRKRIEPFPTPNIFRQDLRVLLEEVSFVDRIIFGRMNYNTEVTAYTQHKQFFNDMSAEVMAFCNECGISYHIKDGTITK